MADLRISELGALAGSNLAGVDELAIVDDSASETKKITVADLIANGVTVISDDTIPGAKILFSAGDITTAALADSAVTTAKVADDAITAAKLADESTVDLVTTLPASGAFAGQLALDTDDNNLYAWDGSAWRSIAAPGSVANINGSTTGEINIVATTSGTSVTISATIDDTTSAAQFLAGPTGSAGAVGYRTIVGSDLPTATTSAKGGVIVNGNGLTLSGDTLEIDNSVTSSATHHVVTYDANGLITGGRVITSADLPAATTTALGGVIVSDGLTVDVAGNLSIDNSVTSGTYTKVTVTAEGLVSGVDNLGADDIPDHSAAKLTSGTIGTSLIANDAITADKIANQATTKFGGAAGSDNVTIFPTGDFQGQFFYDETTQDLYIYTGSSFVPITVLSGNLVNAGAYNASTNQMSSVTSAGSSAGFSVGAALPAPAQTNLNHYVVVDTSGTGTGAAPAVALAPPDMLLSQGVGTEYSLIDVSNAIAGQTASNISFIASGNIVATDVQAALQEVDTEKIAKAGDTMTGALGIGTASSIVFEGSTADDYETTLTVTDPTADRTITFPDVTGNVVTTGDTGTVTSTMITDGTIVNADINASAEIAVSKLADGAAYQILHTDSSGTGVEWASNVDIPGTLDVTSTATFDSTVTATGLITANGKVSFPAGTAAAPSLYSGTDIDTGIYAPAANEFGVATAGQSRLVIDSSGNVGIGTTSPGNPLHIASQYPGIRFQSNIGSYQGRNTITQFDNVFYIEVDNDNAVSNSALAFTVDGTEKMRVDSSGTLGVGCTPNSFQSGFNAVQIGGNLVLNVDSTGAGAGVYMSNNVYRDSGNSRWEYINTDEATQYLQFDGQHAWRYAASGSANTAITWLDAMRIDNSGNVGIGTSSINQTAAARTVVGINGTTSSLLNFNHSDSLAGFFYAASDEFRMEANGSRPLTFRGNGDERMRIDYNGHVGIGKTPVDTNGFTRALDLSGTTGSALYLRNAAGSTNYGYVGYYNSDLYFTNIVSGGNVRFYNGGDERMRIDSSGRVGIGTSDFAATSPYADNLVVKDATDAGITIQGASSSSEHSSLYLGDTTANRGWLEQTLGGGASSTLTIGTAGITRFYNNGGERMRIDSNGDVHIGKTAFTSHNTDGHTFNNSGWAHHCTTNLAALYLNRNNSNGNIAEFYVSNSYIGNINYDGTTCTYNSVSDYRLKENIVDIADGISRVKQLSPRRFNFISNPDTTVDGFIAHEAQSVVPEAVCGEKDGEQMQGIDQSKLVPLLTAALQEAIAKIETLETKVAALEAQ